MLLAAKIGTIIEISKTFGTKFSWGSSETNGKSSICIQISVKKKKMQGEARCLKNNSSADDGACEADHRPRAALYRRRDAGRARGQADGKGSDTTRGHRRQHPQGDRPARPGRRRSNHFLTTF